MSVTFHHPVFDSAIQDKIGDTLEVMGGTGRGVTNTRDGFSGYHAISSSGFPSNVDGTHVFVTQIDQTKDCTMCMGWTSTPTYDSSAYAFPGHKMTGCSFWVYSGNVYPGNAQSVPKEVSRKAKEIVSILTISENGKKITAQWIVDGTEGVVHDVSGELKKGNYRIFPVFVLLNQGQQIQTIPFSQLTSTSPKIEELKKKMNNPPLPSSSTNNEENGKVIQQVRQDLENAQRRLLEQKDKQIEELKRLHDQQLKMKDDQLKMKDNQFRQQLNEKQAELTSKNQEIQMKDKQLELERAEHQKTRNLLHQSKQEMKDMEIHFLKEQNKLLTKESGQRRGRQEQFNVKQERDD